MGMEESVWEDFFQPLSYINTASVLATLVRPRSRGWIKLRSADSSDYPIINPRYYSEKIDLKVMLEGIYFI